MRNDGGSKNHWLNVRLIGRQSNRSALGATVHLESASGKQWQTVHSGSSYCSQSELALTFGLKQDRTVANLIIEWPSGKTQRFQNIPADRFLIIDESSGIAK